MLNTLLNSNYNVIKEIFAYLGYVVNLIPIENNYIFKFWGINSVIPSNLISKTI